MLGQVLIFEILVQILMIIEYENSKVEYIYKCILNTVCITHISCFCNAYCSSPGESAMTCSGVVVVVVVVVVVRSRLRLISVSQKCYF